MNRDVTDVHAEPVLAADPQQLAHLALHRGLIVRRALLASAIRGFLPVPMVDDVLAGRVRAGLYAKLAAGRQVDLPPTPAAILAHKDQGAVAKLGFVAAAAVIAKFAGRKFLSLVAAGRGAEEMAQTFTRATLFDHYCAKLHVGGEITAAEASRLRACLGGKGGTAAPTLAAFREGSRELGRSLLEAPRWVSQRIAVLGERFVHSGGNPDVLDAFPEQARGETAWLDRAAHTVEEAMARAGNEHLTRLVRAFEERWQSGGE
jgi:uncharacterized protein (DUF697 family)